jgi:hypothetical protein
MDSMVTDLLTRWLQQIRGRTVDVIMAGQYFGGKRGEAPQAPETYTIPEEGFTLHFGGAYEYVSTALDGSKHTVREGGTERLEVIHPSGLSIPTEGTLMVAAADEVQFGWHFYGRAQTPENWCVDIYKRTGEEVEHTFTGPIKAVYRGPLPERFLLPEGPFVCLRPG